MLVYRHIKVSVSRAQEFGADGALGSGLASVLHCRAALQLPSKDVVADLEHWTSNGVMMVCIYTH